MLKKIMFSCMLLFSIENQPFFTEFFALIGFAVCARSKPAKMAARFAWSKFKDTPQVALPEFKPADKLAKFAPSSKIALASYAWRAKEVMSQGRSKLTACLEVFQNRMKKPVVFTTSSSQKTNYSCFSAPYTPSRPGSTINQAGAAGNAGANTGSSTNWPFGNLSISQQTNQQQNNYGLFHWYGSEKSEEWAKQFGKTRFWQGVAGGSVLTAWLLKPRESKKDQKS